MASFFASSKIIVFITFTLHVLMGNSITASSVFVTVSLYGTIKLTVTLFMPLAIEKLSETLVSVRRIKVILQTFVFSLTCPGLNHARHHQEQFRFMSPDSRGQCFEVSCIDSARPASKLFDLSYSLSQTWHTTTG